jgi:hypothetical protein
LDLIKVHRAAMTLIAEPPGCCGLTPEFKIKKCNNNLNLNYWYEFSFHANIPGVCHSIFTEALLSC